ncbi:infB [Symbiodinium sp. CCMP2592]|nr:infB [Symbiodinium sp. CCMP2592]
MLPSSPIQDEIGKISDKARSMGILASPSTLQDLYRRNLHEVEAQFWRELNAAGSIYEVLLAEEKCRERCHTVSTTLLLDLLKKQADLYRTGPPPPTTLLLGLHLVAKLWLDPREVVHLLACGMGCLFLAESWATSPEWRAMSLESVEQVLSGTACPALRGLVGKRVIAISTVGWLAQVPIFSHLHELHIGELPGEKMAEILELPRLRVLNVSKLSGTLPLDMEPQAPRLEILMGPGRLASALACPNLQKLLVRVDINEDAGSLTPALQSSSLVALDILDPHRKFTLRSLFTAIRDSGLQFLQRFVYLRTAASKNQKFDLFEGTLLAFRSSLPMQTLKFACLSLNERPDRKERLETQIATIIQRAPELEFWLPDWPGDPPSLPGLFGSQLGDWPLKLQCVSSPNFEDLAYQRIPAFAEKFRGLATPGFKFGVPRHVRGYRTEAN